MPDAPFSRNCARSGSTGLRSWLFLRRLSISFCCCAAEGGRKRGKSTLPFQPPSACSLPLPNLPMLSRPMSEGQVAQETKRRRRAAGGVGGVAPRETPLEGSTRSPLFIAGAGQEKRRRSMILHFPSPHSLYAVTRQVPRPSSVASVRPSLTLP